MIRFQILFFSILLTISTSIFSQDQTPAADVPAPAISAEDQALASAKKLVGLIRYKKNDKALALIHLEKFSGKLVGNTKLTETERKEFEEAVAEYITNKAFPLALKYFDKIDLTYDKPAIEGKQARIASAILYKGSDQVKFAWILEEVSGAWYITDFEIEGRLASETNRTKSIEPSIKKNGVKATIALVQKVARN